MKTVGKMLALVIVVALAIVMSYLVFADDGDVDPGGPRAELTAPETGSITVNSPVVGATYKVYKVFDMTTNAAVDSFSYTINEESPFYAAVNTYAQTEANGLTLTAIAGSDPATYSVTVSANEFDAQKFGKAVQAVLTSSTTPAASSKAGVEDSGQLRFEGLDLGYFLINPTYPPASAVTLTMGEQTFKSDEDLDEDGELTAEALAKIDAYVAATVDDTYVDKYIADNGIATNKDGSPLNSAGRTEYRNDLIAAVKADAIRKIKDTFASNPSDADNNVKEPILVFLDSSQPDAVINEKNELNKWDIPVNPTGETQPGTPDYGEPKGGKNIVVQENPTFYADWSEAEIGESVHYQIRVNAMNFVRTGESATSVCQVKEFFLADYQSARMHFDESKGLKVSVWQGDDDNDSQAATKVNVTRNEEGSLVNDLDYTAKAGSFFMNTSDADGDFEAGGDIFGSKSGIMVPWVKVVEAPAEEELEALTEKFPVYTITNVPIDGEYETEEAKTDGDGNKIPVMVNNNGSWEPVTGQYVSVNNRVVDGENNLLDADGNKIPKTKPVYTFSRYNSDVTIVVDYWMILDDDAIVDEPGNRNYAQYGWSPVDNQNLDGTPKTPTNPDEDTDKPSRKERLDLATVYTFALAWVKVDEKGKALAGAEFELPFYVKKTKDQDAYVYAFKTIPETFAEGDSADNYTNKVKTGQSGVITIKGVEQGTYSVKETAAPAGFNILTAPFNVVAKKSDVGVTTKTKTVIYLDKDGNITEEVTTATQEYTTDQDSQSESVPVHQFSPIVNQQGTELPSTGGMGTKVFYILGVILVIGAGVVLVTRRRMNAE